MFIHQLGMPVSAQQDAEIIEPRHDTLQFHTVDQKDRQWCFLLANVIEKSVLEVLRAFCRHLGGVRPSFLLIVNFVGNGGLCRHYTPLIEYLLKEDTPFFEITHVNIGLMS